VRVLCASGYVPGPQEYRVDALEEGVQSGRITKSSGEITSTLYQQEEFLADNHTYQTWRLMSNMKEVLAECVAWVLAKRFPTLDETICKKLLQTAEACVFVQTGDLKEIAIQARDAKDLPVDRIFARTLGMLHWCAGQFWEDKRNQILSTSRLRTLLYRSDMVAAFKEKILEVNGRKSLNKVWKPDGMEFLESLPNLPLGS